MRAIIFHSVAEYCDTAMKMTIKHNKNEVRTEIWASYDGKIKVETQTYFSANRAYKKFLEKVGGAICGGWKVLNAYPERETWETKRTK